jgi:hypothetical protein
MNVSDTHRLKSLEDENAKLKAELEQNNKRHHIREVELSASVKNLEGILKKKTERDLVAPKKFRVAMTCHDGTSDWCQVHIETAGDEDVGAGLLGAISKTHPLPSLSPRMASKPSDGQPPSPSPSPSPVRSMSLSKYSRISETVTWKPKKIVEDWISQKEALHIAARAKEASNEKGKDEQGPDGELSDDAGRFSLEGDETEDDSVFCGLIPVSIQDELKAKFEQEREKLTHDLAIVQTEIQTLQNAYDKFKDRARDSLRRTADEQGDTLKKVEELRGLLTIERKATADATAECQKQSALLGEAEKALNAKQKATDAELETVRVELSAEKSARLVLSERVGELDQYMNHREEEDKRRKMQEEECRGPQMQALQEELETKLKTEAELREKLKVLSKEMGKRSEAAAKLCTDKDRELGKMREKLGSLEALARQHNLPTTVPSSVSAPKSSAAKLAARSSKAALSSSSSSFSASSSSFSFPSQESLGSLDSNSEAAIDAKLQARQEYLRKAFYRFMLAKEKSEMKNLCSVVCTILSLSKSEQTEVLKVVDDAFAPALGVYLAPNIDNITKDVEDMSSSIAATISSWF